MYFLHGLKKPEHINDELKVVVERLRKEKKLKFFGFSCHDGTVAELLELAAKTPWIDAVMFRYNFQQYGNEKLNRAIDAAHKAKVGLIAMKTQGSAVSFEPQWKKFEQTGKWNKYQAVMKAVWADERIAGAVSDMDNLDKVRENVGRRAGQDQADPAEIEALYHYAAATRSVTCDGCDHLCGAALGEPLAADRPDPALPHVPRRLRQVGAGQGPVPQAAGRGAPRSPASTSPRPAPPARTGSTSPTGCAAPPTCWPDQRGATADTFSDHRCQNEEEVRAVLRGARTAEQTSPQIWSKRSAGVSREWGPSTCPCRNGNRCVHRLTSGDDSGRVLPFDGAAAQEFAVVASLRRQAGLPMTQLDAQIAGIVRSRGGTLATRNTADFEDCGIELSNPWQT